MRLSPVQINVNNENEFIKRLFIFQIHLKSVHFIFSNKITEKSYQSIIMTMISSLRLKLQSQ